MTDSARLIARRPAICECGSLLPPSPINVQLPTVPGEACLAQQKVCPKAYSFRGPAATNLFSRT
jgi:hypothetical protein